MKRSLLVVLIILLSSAFLFADVEHYSFGLTGGYSNVYQSPSMGFNSTYQYLGEVNSDLYFGFNGHWDLSVQFKNERANLSTGVILGATLGYAFNPSMMTTFTVGPEFFYEAGKLSRTDTTKYEYLGIGIGVDVNHNVFFGSERDFGIVIGATGYINLGALSRKNIDKSFSYDIIGYVGFVLRDGVIGEKVYYDIY